ncbi:MULTISPECIES: MSC_0775 family lipoprotein [unclassified Mycoplasma]|uniref:MSC_0775 family lipoprotein n=1 Tax=unclassified Mycoplasma TaxID=2683645 RepID=UPI00211C490F|nr:MULTISPECIES: hypothetical protein [unclassified Mycoplasma]UUM20141.1 hypothetical protein NPA11_01810 [Mycoplasma sp. 1578d]UUM25121.1 hypothetical protein NPA12_01785 [Mycoplasma sp. 3686d]
MKKYKIFKKFILPISVLSGVSTTLVLASCTSTAPKETQPVEKTPKSPEASKPEQPAKITQPSTQDSQANEQSKQPSKETSSNESTKESTEEPAKSQEKPASNLVTLIPSTPVKNDQTQENKDQNTDKKTKNSEASSSTKSENTQTVPVESPSEKITLTNKISSSNILDEIQEKLDFTPGVFFEFPSGVDVANIVYENFVKNNYIGQQANFFNDSKFINLLKKQSPNNDAFIDELEFNIQYHNIRQNLNNLNQTIIPVDIIHHIDQSKGLSEYRTINFIINNLGSNTNANLKILTSQFNELTQLLEHNKPTLSLGDQSNINALINKYRLDQLSNEQLNQIFQIALAPQVQTKINELWTNHQTVTKIFVNKISFNTNLNHANVSLRVAVSDNRDEVSKINQNNSLSKEQIQQQLASVSKLNIGKDIELDFNYQNTFLSSFLLNEQLARLIKINIKDNTFAGYNFNHLNLSDLTFYKPDRLSTLKLVSHQVLNAKNANFTFKATDLITQKEYTFTKHIGLGDYANFFQKDFAENNLKAYYFQAKTLTNQNISTITEQMFKTYSSNIFTGGYDELRAFYPKSPSYPYQLSLGEDYLAPTKTPIVAPYDGEILGIVFNDKKDPAKNALGIGTVLLMRVNVADLNLSPREKETYFKDSQYAYIGFVRLDQDKTFSNSALGISKAQVQEGSAVDVYATKLDPKTNQQVPITPTNPLKVTKGQIIGYTGEYHKNGSWMPQTRISIIASGTKNWNANGFYSERKNNFENGLSKYNPTDSKTNRWTALRMQLLAISTRDKSHQNPPNNNSPIIDPKTGAAIDPKNQFSNFGYLFTIFPIQDQELKDGFRNPNILFKVRSKETYAFDILALSKPTQS